MELGEQATLGCLLHLRMLQSPYAKAHCTPASHWALKHSWLGCSVTGAGEQLDGEQCASSQGLCSRRKWGSRLLAPPSSQAPPWHSMPQCEGYLLVRHRQFTHSGPMWPATKHICKDVCCSTKSQHKSVLQLFVPQQAHTPACLDAALREVLGKLVQCTVFQLLVVINANKLLHQYFSIFTSLQLIFK